MESSSCSDASLKQQLEELQKQLGKKQRFEEAVSSINSLLKLHYPSPPLRKSILENDGGARRVPLASKEVVAKLSQMRRLRRRKAMRAVLEENIASPFSVKWKASTSLFTVFAQVLAVSYNNRSLPFPSQQSGPDGLALDSSRLYTVQKVQELNALLKVIPIWSTGIMIAIAGSQHSFPELQASTMNRQVFEGFQISAASLTVFVYVTAVAWVVLYERLVIPLASKIKGKQVYISINSRMGIGLFFSVVALGLAAMVEKTRLSKVILEGHMKSPSAMVNMSVMRLLLQYILMGVAESLNTLGQFEFYHREFPKVMSSIGNSLYFLSLAGAHLFINLRALRFGDGLQKLGEAK
ncbi:hypothetical protein REPUB_Repub14bG0048200 [Reevesia pubescens]